MEAVEGVRVSPYRLGLGAGEVGVAGEQAGECFGGFQPCERGAKAEVGAGAEGEMAGGGPGQVQSEWVGVAGGVSVGLLDVDTPPSG